MIPARMTHWVLVGLAGLVVICGSAFFLSLRFFPENTDRLMGWAADNRGVVLTIACMLVALVVAAVDLVFRLAIVPLDRLIEEISLIGNVNEQHRIKMKGNVFFGRLVKAINGVASRFEAVKQYDREKIKSVRAVIEKERNILAAIMAELPEGVLACNTHGIILLYNQQAKQMLTHVAEQETRRPRPDALVGLGRTIYPMIDRHQLQHALDDVTEKRKRGNDDITAHFVARGGRNELLRTEVVPVLDHEEAFAGFILMFRDITRHLRTAGQVAGTMTDLARAVRTTSASIRASIEAIMEYPEMDREQLDRFREIIYNESVILGAITDQIDNDNCARRDTEWPLMPIRSNDLTAYLQRTAAEKLDLTIDVLDGQRTFDIRVDKYALTLALLFVMDQIRQTDGTDHFICRVDQKADFVHIDFSWTGQALKVETLHQWDRMWLQIAGADLPFTLKQMLRYHGAEICPVTLSTATPSSGMRIFLPSCKPFAQPPQLRTVAIMPQSRPEFFDFDLFERDEPHPEVAQRPLLELQYTVFDTETTGLDPGGGDEILSIGAIRIVNGRLLHSECFDHLIDPRRTIPSASIRIHGIDSEMVAGHPDINTVLPKFHRFAANTILVAHNAAFDMRLLQVKEKSTGIQFSHPVLDTLLLSAVVHPAQSDHTLEAIADRMGVPIQGRHSAMGDAVVTGRIFVKMIPLLAEKGITTLSEAITASRKTVYARITY